MRVPTATYRLQFSPSFGFLDAKKVIPYLHALGISDIYASPIFKAKTGSTHGYDIVDSNALNPELGSQADFNKMMAERRKYKMGWLQDIVPNHMAFDSENRLLMDVFENGPNSRFFNFFDIAWDHPDETLRGKVLVPILGRLYNKALASGKILLELSACGLSIRYYEHRLPIGLVSYSRILKYNLEYNKDASNSDFKELLGLCDRFDSFEKQPCGSRRDGQIREAKENLWNLYTADGSVKTHTDSVLNFYNGQNTQKNKFAPLEALLSEQHFKLALWRKAGERINYRRFFYLNEFIGLRVEDPEVFKFTHQLILQLVKDGTFTGLRIDHVDGLLDPTNYLMRLREKLDDTYIVVEKILESQEKLPDCWPIQGTTGYEFANFMNELFCCGKNEEAFSEIYSRFIGSAPDYNNLLYEKKKLIVQKYMRGDVRYLVGLIQKYAESKGQLSNQDCCKIEDAITEIITAFSVYRTYINHDTCLQADQRRTKKAIELAKSRNPSLNHTIEAIGRYLLCDNQADRENPTRKDAVNLIMRFQQLTGPVMAKGFEDTFLYCYNRLVSLNEVGSSPDEFGISIDKFDEFNAARAKQQPNSLNAISTHDTKRGEDVRARINVLSEMPEQWSSKIEHWRRINETKKTVCNTSTAPSPNDEYLLYQMLTGALPFKQSDFKTFGKRIKEYFIKAIREAKEHTSWVEPNQEYETACAQFVDRLFTFLPEDEFWQDFSVFQKQIAEYAIYNSLSQTLIKMTAPGVPDFYRGSELFDLNLVDPDNRRPIDFKVMVKLLEQIKSEEMRDSSGFLTELLHCKEDGRIKIFLIYKTLAAREQYKHIFEKGLYVPVRVEGCHKGNIVAFARVIEEKTAITVAPRFVTSIVRPAQPPIGENLWEDTRIITANHSQYPWLNVITGEKIEGPNELLVGHIMNKFPAGLVIAAKRN